MDNTSFHIPVLKLDSIQQLITDKNGIYIDATLGYGGHTREILDTTTHKARIYGIDKDIDAIEFNKNELAHEKRFTLNMDVSPLLMSTQSHGIFMELLMEYSLIWACHQFI